MTDSRSMTLRDRFESKVEMITECGCWIWMASCDKYGYGFIKVNGKQRHAHRVSFEIYIGPIPEGKSVLHSCDTPSCVCPYHIFSGTQSDNAQDCIRKGRWKNSKGKNHGLAKLNNIQVSNIKTSNISQRELAKKYHVSEGLISMIKNGKRWSHIS